MSCLMEFFIMMNDENTNITPKELKIFPKWETNHNKAIADVQFA